MSHLNIGSQTHKSNSVGRSATRASIWHALDVHIVPTSACCPWESTQCWQNIKQLLRSRSKSLDQAKPKEWKMQRYQSEQSSWPVSLSSWIYWCWLCQLWQGETVIGVDSMPLDGGHYSSLPQGWCNDKLEHWSYLNDSACQCQMLCSEKICSVGISESKTFSCWCSGIQKTIWAGWRTGWELWIGVGWYVRPGVEWSCQQPSSEQVSMYQCKKCTVRLDQSIQSVWWLNKVCLWTVIFIDGFRVQTYPFTSWYIFLNRS